MPMNQVVKVVISLLGYFICSHSAYHPANDELSIVYLFLGWFINLLTLFQMDSSSFRPDRLNRCHQTQFLRLKRAILPLEGE
jgi:hypothetical protein